MIEDHGDRRRADTVFNAVQRVVVELDVQPQHFQQAGIEIEGREQNAQGCGPDDGLRTQAEQGEGEAEHDQLARLGGEHQRQQQQRGDDQVEIPVSLGVVDRRFALRPDLDAVEVAETDQERADGGAIRAVVRPNLVAQVGNHPELEAPGQEGRHQRGVDQGAFELQRGHPLGQQQQRHETQAEKNAAFFDEAIDDGLAVGEIGEYGRQHQEHHRAVEAVVHQDPDFPRGFVGHGEDQKGGQAQADGQVQLVDHGDAVGIVRAFSKHRKVQCECQHQQGQKEKS